ncbi:MAG: restriction endonuclease subunit S [Oscillospiraceae bacterium]|nr:restriction endonuclease subunit S [Oscillospiraceae bacterium]
MPALRFKDKNGQAFEAPDELTIQDLFDKVKTTNKDGANKNVITNSAEHGLIPQREFFDKDIAVEGNTSKYTIIKDGDFVYNPRKSSTAPYGPFNCYTREEPGIVSPLYSCLTPKNKAYTPYLLYYFASPAWYSYIYHNGNQGGARHDRVGMTDDLLQGIPVLLPCQEEQDKITAFLSLYDKRIVAQASKVEALETRRKGLLQQIFSQEIRFKADDGSEFPDWESHAMGEFFTERKEKAQGGEELLSVTIANGVIRQADSDKRDNSSEDKSNYKRVMTGDMAYNTMRMWQGAEGVSYWDGIVSPAYTIIVPKDGVNAEFFMVLFKTYEALKQFTIYSQGMSSDQWNLKFDIFADLEFDVPCSEEQAKIVAFFRLLDKQIQIEKDKLESTKQVKKGLLQQMFV